MLFENLSASSALNLERYTDIDHFRESERYVCAESLPLGPTNFSPLRASLVLPSCSLSLVRTFPRIINGYEMFGRLVIVVPMNDIGSARVNGRSVGHSLILLKGSADCTVYEPEGRLVAILSIRPEALDARWLNFTQGHLLLELPPGELRHLQGLLCRVLEMAGKQPEAMRAPGVSDTTQASLFSAFVDAMRFGQIDGANGHRSLRRYKQIVDQIDSMLHANAYADLSCARLAEEMGISVRTLQTAVQALCGSGPHYYSRLKRLWAVRQQLRAGASGQTVKASALSHGFWHMGEFSNLYRDAFGELPSFTLASARRSA